MKNQMTEIEKKAADLMRQDGLCENIIAVSRQANKKLWPLYLTRAANEEAVCVA